MWWFFMKDLIFVIKIKELQQISGESLEKAFSIGITDACDSFWSCNKGGSVV